MADSDESLGIDVSSLSINENGTQADPDEYHEKWGFNLPDLYKLALKFYKEKSGKAIHLSYKDKLKLVAYTKQVAYGKYRNDVSPDVGFLDVVGSDRRQAWQALGDMSRETAMEEFIKQLDSRCSLFKPFIHAHKAEREEKLKREKEEEEQRRKEQEENERKKMEEEAHRRLEAERQRQLQQEMQIRAALNQQTAVQFRQYAEQQYPGSKQQQEELIQQLQEQHFQQYMQQVYQQQLMHQQQQYQQLNNMAAMTATTATSNSNQNPPPTTTTNQQQKVPDQNVIQQNNQQQMLQQNGPVDPTTTTTQATEVNGQAEDELTPIAAASMWMRKDVKEFKESLRKDKDSVIKIGSGETVTVRVPTHEDGTCLFWEFATDYYDLGFGVYFEWTIAPSNTVSVHVSESSDEDELEEDEAQMAQGGKSDIEKGVKHDDKPPTDEIIPVYRRDCHEEVYCGSHAYPGQGVYLLKFDNSYSLWRSKTLYYRVYYSR
ncbi:hypothetical protein KUTeg_013740 [Tegillarca granosa]|uniref:Golgi resident protein GCP60 n=1 Tax=Tegillarca granosa TaxID=220873 RepID=A0ABQ9EX15_TEGGR|nr:hypothetical protein KUTeg_013740 [Tegillarca granosa]